jgi:hypothetical protein
VVFIIGAVIVDVIMPRQPSHWALSPLRVVLATVIPWSLIGIGWYVWHKIRRSK